MNFCQLRKEHSGLCDWRNLQKGALRKRPKRKHFLLNVPYPVIYRTPLYLYLYKRYNTKLRMGGQNDEESMRMSGTIDLGGFSVKTMDATKKSVEARVVLLSRYSFRWRGGLKSPWGNGCKLSEYSISWGKIRVISDATCGKRTKKTRSGCDCTDVLRFAYSLSALHGIILQTKTM